MGVCAVLEGANETLKGKPEIQPGVGIGRGQTTELLGFSAVLVVQWLLYSLLPSRHPPTLALMLKSPFLPCLFSEVTACIALRMTPESSCDCDWTVVEPALGPQGSWQALLMHLSQ